MDDKSKHDASGQMLGYVFQAYASLLLLLSSTDAEAMLCLEKFDDVSFHDDKDILALIQTKHQVNQPGRLNDTSVDLWRTLWNWSEAIDNDTTVAVSTNFIIITTAVAPEGSAASYLKDVSRNCDKALELLECAAKRRSVQSNEKYYEAFLLMKSRVRKQLVDNIYIYDSSDHISSIEKRILPYIRNSAPPDCVDRVYERAIGWWFKYVILCLCSDEPLFISCSQLQTAIADIACEYRSDSLPIDVDPSYEPTDEELDDLLGEKRVFIEQLKLVSVSDLRLKRCIRDYYNAYQQRSKWVREQLLLVDELTKYEARLVDEWARLYLIMQEELGDNPDDQRKIAGGRSLFNKIEDLGIPIRERLSEPFVMRGTYHELANNLKVGWHTDFKVQLQHLLWGEVK